MKRLVFASLMGCLFLYPGSQAQEPVPASALKGLDPIELAQGKEVAGNADLTVDYGRYRYSFATKENKAAFEKEPRRHAIQFAGACARMGPLSGVGNPARYLVSDGRIYIFASDICRANFKKNPRQHIDEADAPPQGTREAREQGQRLIESALKGFGDAERVDAVKNIQATLPRVFGAGKDKVEGVLTTTLAFPEQLRQDESWGKWSGSHTLNGADSFELTSDRTRKLDEFEREFLTRELFRQPLAILKARQRPDFVAFAAGTGKLGEREVDLVKIAVAGATSTLSLEPKTGRVLAIAYRGRPGIGPIGAIEKTFTEFKAVDGLVLPHAVRMTWEGKTLPTHSGTYSEVKVSADLGASFFRPPVAK